MSEFYVDPFDPSSISAACESLDAWCSTLKVAAGFFMQNEIGDLAIETMLADAHGPEDSPNNHGGLREAISQAEKSYDGDDTVVVAVRSGHYGEEGSKGAYLFTNPLKEKQWKGQHGGVPAPHDFTRNVEPYAHAMAQKMWDESMGGFV